MLPKTELRNAELGDLVTLLQEQADVKYDAVVQAGRLRYDNGVLVVAGGAMQITDDGVTEADALLSPTEGFEDGVADRLGIPRQYLRKIRESGRTVLDPYFTDLQAPGLLLDLNVNGWLQETPERKFLVRGFRTDDPDETGIARALLSDRFAPYDNLDVLLAALDGVRSSGVEAHVTGANLTERMMRVTIEAPAVAALAPVLLANYRSPFMPPGSEVPLPLVHAGFEIRNSETGGSAFTIVPRIVVEICKNGMTMTKEALRQVHLGGRLEEGVISWSADTQHHAVELVKAKARDAVAAFLDVEFVKAQIEKIERTSATPVTDALGTIERVAKVHAFTQEEQRSILDAFVRSGDLTAGGVMQAVTATAQGIESSDRAAELEDVALDVLATAARA